VTVAGIFAGVAFVLGSLFGLAVRKKWFDPALPVRVVKGLLTYKVPFWQWALGAVLIDLVKAIWKGTR
jgi:hypothetical protein